MLIRQSLSQRKGWTEFAYNPSSHSIHTVSAVEQGSGSARLPANNTAQSQALNETDLPQRCSVIPLVWFGAGVEPATQRSSVSCSTHWAIQRAIALPLSYPRSVDLRVGFEPTYIAWSGKACFSIGTHNTNLQALVRQMGIQNPYRWQKNSVPIQYKNIYHFGNLVSIVKFQKWTKVS